MSRRGLAGYSLKRKLLLAVLSTVAVVWLATAVYSYFEALHEINELLDAHLTQSASLIVAQVGHELEEIDVEHAPQLHERSRRVAFQIWERGRLRLHSANAPEERLSARDEGFSAATINGRGWRVFSTWDTSRRFLVQVAERDQARREMAAGMATGLLAPLLLALPVLGVLVWLSIARALRPLGALGRQVRERAPDDVAPLAAVKVPVEVAPLVDNLNALFERVGRLIENERRFTADAAHELRTPLAALRTQAQVALGAQNDATRVHALHNVIAACDRAARLVEQLLTLARLEPDQLRGSTEACELRMLAGQTIAELAAEAVSRNVQIELAEGPPVRVEGDPALISVLIRNLVDNAVRYSPQGGKVRVEAAASNHGPVLSITDQGPGIPPEERSKVGQRFYRIMGTGQTGSGLGLSIVRRVAEIHHATVEMDEGPLGQGLRVTISFQPTGPHGPAPAR